MPSYDEGSDSFNKMSSMIRYVRLFLKLTKQIFRKTLVRNIFHDKQKCYGYSQPTTLFYATDLTSFHKLCLQVNDQSVYALGSNIYDLSQSPRKCGLKHRISSRSTIGHMKKDVQAYPNWALSGALSLPRFARWSLLSFLIGRYNLFSKVPKVQKVHALLSYYFSMYICFPKWRRTIT